MNSEAVRMLAYLGCSSVTLSRELSEPEIRSLPQGICEMILPVYGRARLMLLNHCPMRTYLGRSADRARCFLCSTGKGTAGTWLTDRLGARYPLFPLRLPEGCQVELMDSRPLHLAGKLKGLPALSWLLVFTDETLAVRRQSTAHYAALLKQECPLPLNIQGTVGRFAEGVL